MIQALIEDNHRLMSTIDTFNTALKDVRPEFLFLNQSKCLPLEHNILNDGKSKYDKKD